MTGLLFKVVIIWFLMVVAAITNAAIREKLLTPAIGHELSLPVSGILLSIFIFIIAYLSMPFFGSLESKQYRHIGSVWFVLTLLFEFLFGHFVVGKSWYDILQAFNIAKGDLFVVALLVLLIAPWASARLRRLI